MMRKLWLFILLSILGLIAAVYILSQPEEAIKTVSNQLQPAAEEKTDFTARFEIYTLGTKRIFTQAMYHNLSSDVYIENPDPSIVYVKQAGITWDDFFKTLPFSVTKDCLVTGTKQTFCTNETAALRFFLNDQETPDALDLEIQAGDMLSIRYTN